MPETQVQEKQVSEAETNNNIEFIEKIQYNNIFYTFNFRKAKVYSDIRFDIDVKDSLGNYVYFSMEKIIYTWKIITPNIPNWLEQLEGELNSIINKYHR